MFKYAHLRLKSDAETLFALSKHWNLNYPSAKHVIQRTLKFTEPPTSLPIFRILSHDGSSIENPCPHLDRLLNRVLARRMLQTMIEQSVMDKIMHDCQRQGRISFYLTCEGELGSVVGSAAALGIADTMYGQYRESAAFLYRGYTMEQMVAQCVGSIDDPAKGRQMPIHYGSKELNFHTISSPVGTQLTHAAGCGYGLRLKKEGNVCMCYFGEGTASEGDFHAALNMAATLRCRTIFFCRNNAFAISTPCAEQYAGDGIAGRGGAYGIPSIRVDGNDPLAVLAATSEAKAMCVARDTPILIEAMTYRSGDHSTSDDASQYRKDPPVDVPDAISRLQRFLVKKGWWSESETEALKAETKENLKRLLNKHDQLPKPCDRTILDDVYDVKPQHLIEQTKEICQRDMEELRSLIK